MIWFMISLGALLLLAVSIGVLVIVDALVWEPKRRRREELRRFLLERAPRINAANRRINRAFAAMTAAANDASRSIAAFGAAFSKRS